jgi:tRNA dimethylallyltransferase
MIDLISVLGHTAGGKTAFAAHLAFHLGSEIISADSRQVYRGMDIGTGKDYKDYVVDGQQYTDISERGKIPVLCGGTGLYIESILRNYRLLNVPADAELRKVLENKSHEELVAMLKLYGPVHNITDTVNRKRLVRAIEIARYQLARPEDPGGERELQTLILGIRFDRDTRRERITKRLRERMKDGMVEEVERLLESGVTADKLDYYGLEYRYVSKYILGEFSYEEMFSRLNTAIHQFAKRQMTYFRGMERRGINIHWLDGQLSMQEKIKQAMALYHAT